MPLELERYLRYRHLPELRKRLVFLCVNCVLNLAINIQTILGDRQIDWVSHLAAFIMGILLMFATSDFTMMPAFLSRYKYVVKRLCTLIAIAAGLIMFIISLTRLRIHNIGRDLYDSGVCKK
jgi:cytochrome c biogenesis protein CcdA